MQSRLGRRTLSFEHKFKLLKAIILTPVGKAKRKYEHYWDQFKFKPQAFRPTRYVFVENLSLVLATNEIADDMLKQTFNIRSLQHIITDNSPWPHLMSNNLRPHPTCSFRRVSELINTNTINEYDVPNIVPIVQATHKPLP